MKTNITLEVTTKQSIEDIDSEMDLRNTWCYATIPNHDKLRLMGYDHEPIGACKKYYYIDNDNKINDFEYHPDGNQIRLNKQGEFEYVTLSSQQGKSECQFTKYGFENHKDCVILTKVGSWLIGYVKNGTQAPKPAMWFEYDGSSSATPETIPNLTPIKKPWYETCKFPCLVKDEDGTFLISEIEWYSEKYIATLTPLTNDEIEGLKQ